MERRQMTDISQVSARNFRVDVLRGIAITLVLILHFHLTYRLQDGLLGDILSKDLVLRVARNGNYGVTMFFVISGFLITSTCLRRWNKLSQVQPKVFYAFRLARIIPCLAIALAVIVGLGLCGASSFINKSGGKPLPDSYYLLALISVMMFWHNILMEWTGYFNYCINIYWSLSVEEIFYMTFPLLCIFVKQDIYIILILSLFILIGPIYRYFHSDDELYFMYSYFACFDAIAFGCGAAIISKNKLLANLSGKVSQVIAAVTLVVVYLYGITHNVVLGFTLIAAATSVLLIGSSDAITPKFLARSRGLSILRWFGRHSYELYLFHIVVLGLMRDAIPRDVVGYYSKVVLLLIFVALSSAVAAAVSRFYSEPMNHILRELFLRRRIAAEG